MLTKRQELILKMIIKDFTDNHEPVGSKTIMAQLPIKVSSATIRNEMAVLEDKGLIEKTHSSSGRIPSTLGYRFYLDNLVESIQIPKEIYQKVMFNLDRPFHQVNEIVEEAAKILSDLTSYTAFAAGPELNSVVVTGFRIVPLSNRQIMAILVTSDGSVKSQVYAIPRGVSGSEIEKAVRLINDKLVGRSIFEISTMSLNDLVGTIDGDNSSANQILELLEDVFKDVASEQLYVDGQINLLNNYDASNVDELKSLYQLLDRDSYLTNLLDLNEAVEQPIDEFPVQVRLGNELPGDLLKNYSLLTASYSVGNHGNGVIALLGPSNMPYSQMISLMGYFRNELAKKLLDYYGNFQ